MIIKVADWYKYQPRKDLKTMSWFRIEASFALNPQLFSLKSEEKWLFVCILSLAALSNCDFFDVTLKYLSKFSGVSIKKIDSALSKYEQKQLITINSRVSNRTPTVQSITLQTNKQTNKQTDRRTGTRKDVYKKEVDEIIDYLNQKTGKKLDSSATAHKKHIIPKLKAGHPVSDFKLIIDNKMRSFHAGKFEHTYLKPSTLFIESHFDDYLNEIDINASKAATDRLIAALGGDIGDKDPLHESRA